MTDDNNIQLPDEEEDDSGELTDEETGESSKFEHLMTLTYEGNDYVVLLPLDDEGNEPEGDEGEVFILAIEQDENGEDIYVSVDDEDIAQAVFDQFVAAMDDEDFEEEK